MCQDGEMSKRRGLIRVALVGAFVAGFLLLVLLTQDRIERANGQGFDGTHYHLIAEEFSEGQPFQADAPFAFRIGTPVVAGVVSEVLGVSTIDAFGIVNLLAGATFFGLLFLYLRRTGSSPNWALALVLSALATWVMPFRMVLFYPVLSDVIPLALLVGVLIMLDRSANCVVPWSEVVIVSGIIFCGSFFREQMIVAGIAASVQFLRRRPTWSSFAKATMPIAASVFAIGITHLMVKSTGKYSIVSAVGSSFEQHSFDDLVLAFFLAFGVVAVLAIVFAPTIGHWLLEQRYRFGLVIATFGVAWLAGSDMERFLTFASPVIFAAVGRSLTQYDWAQLSRFRIYASGAAGIGVLLFSQGFFLPMRDEISPFGLDAADLVRNHHALPVLSVLNSPSFAANFASLTPPLFIRLLLIEWIIVTVTAVLLLRPPVSAWMKRILFEAP